MGKYAARGLPCLDTEGCRASDARAEFADGKGSYCFSCQTYFHDDGSAKCATEPQFTEKGDYELVVFSDPAGLKRGLDPRQCDRFDYRMGQFNGKKVHVAVYRDAEGKIQGYKWRGKGKSFGWVGRGKPCFYGQHACEGTKVLTITEGEIDALSVATIQQKDWPVVSLPDGAGSVETVFKEHIDWLRKFEKIVLAFDMDKPGREAVEKAVKLLPPGVAYVADLPLKDPNEVLKEKGRDALHWALWNAKVYKPETIVGQEDVFTLLTKKRERGVPFAFKCVDEALYGQRAAEITMHGAGTGVGKTTIMAAQANHLIQLGQRVGVIFLEDTVQEAALKILSHRVGHNLITDFDCDYSVYEKEWSEIQNGLEFYNPEAGWNPEDITEAIRWMASGLKCNTVILDHVSGAVSGVATEGDERKRIDELMTQFRQMVIRYGFHLHLVSHLSQPAKDRRTHEEGGAIRLTDFRGSGTLKQIPNSILAYTRDTQAEEPEDRDTTAIYSLKARITGITGHIGNLIYDRNTGLLTEA